MEEDGTSLTGRLAGSEVVRTSAMAVFEAAAGLSRIANAPVAEAMDLVERFLREVGAKVVAIDQETASLALGAFDRFGKGRHPAALNIGDCFAYACARQHDLSLLCKGNDFPLTDIRLG